MSVSQPSVPAFLPIRRRSGSLRAFALVDEGDFDALKDFNWRLVAGRYAGRSVGNGVIYLHRQLLSLEPGDGRVTDHINRNPLDNRRANLRVVTQAENCQNCAPQRNGLAGLRGVSFDPRFSHRRQPWRARVGKHWVGYFATKEAAADAASEARRALLPYSNEDA